MSFVIVRLTGGLGNQMFQYAAGRHLALKNQSTLLLDTTEFETYKLRKYTLHHFNIQAAKASWWQVKVALNPQSWWTKSLQSIFRNHPALQPFRVFRQKGFDYDAELLELEGNSYLDGYWQSPSYFQEIESEIRRDFSVIHPACERNKELSKQMACTQSVSVHVRRGDYYNNPKNQSIYGICYKLYYDRAVSFLRQRLGSDLVYYIFSDDIIWARANLKFEGAKVFVDWNNATRDFEDLRLMTQCRHHITANSTFSWWGAWLGHSDGITLTPNRWFADETKGPKMDDLLPRNWIRIPVGESV
jgi:hypothetical protein